MNITEMLIQMQRQILSLNRLQKPKRNIETDTNNFLLFGMVGGGWFDN